PVAQQGDGDQRLPARRPQMVAHDSSRIAGGGAADGRAADSVTLRARAAKERTTMLKQVDRVQIAVRDAAAAARTIGAVLGAEVLRQDEVAALGARRTAVQAGSSIIELLEPASGGPVGDFLQRWGGGLFAAGFSVDDIDA